MHTQRHNIEESKNGRIKEEQESDYENGTLNQSASKQEAAIERDLDAVPIQV